MPVKIQKSDNYRAFNWSIHKCWQKVQLFGVANMNKEIIKWCYEHCQSRYSYDIGHYRTTFYFKNQNDFTLFTLTWA